MMMGFHIDEVLNQLDLAAARNEREFLRASSSLTPNGAARNQPRFTSGEIARILSALGRFAGRDLIAQDVHESRARSSAPFDWTWVGMTLALMITILVAPQALAGAEIPSLAVLGVFFGGSFLSYQIYKVVERKRFETVRQKVLAEAATLKRDAARYGVEARVLELEFARAGVGARRRERRVRGTEA